MNAVHGQTGGMDQVQALIIRLAPEAVCDDCITEKLALVGAHQARARTIELAAMKRFERSTRVCSLCCETRSTIRQLPI
jgi:hypothetical protein